MIPAIPEIPEIQISKAVQPFGALTQALERGTSSLQVKSTWLRQHRSADPIQQMQTDTIIELCDAVRQLQQAVSALPIILPDVQGARDAAANTLAKTTPVVAYKRP